MHDGSASFWVALCASCALHGAAVAALAHNARLGGVSSGEAARPAMIVSLGTVSPELARHVQSRHSAGVLPLAFSAADAGAQEEDGALLVPPEPRFLGMDELDAPPEMSGNIELAPPLLGIFSDSAHAVLVLFIDSAGHVENVELEASTLPAAYVETTMTAFRNAVFKPGERAGQPVNSRIRIDISVE